MSQAAKKICEETQREQKIFEEQGYIVVDDVFSQQDLLNFKKALKHAVNLQLKRATKKYPYLKSTLVTLGAAEIDVVLQELRNIDPLYVSMVQMTISRTPEFFRLTSNIKMVQFVKMLLGLPEDGLLYELSNGVVFTMPHDETNKHDSNVNLAWHKDTFYTIPRSRFIQIWAPLLHDATEEIGTLQVCPGSHKNDIGKQKYNPNANFNHRYTMDESEISKYKPQPIELKLGQLLIFDGRLIHGSGKNTSNHVRCTMLGLCHDVANENFLPLAIEYKYLEQTPEAYYYEVFGDEEIKSIINEQAAYPTHFD